MTQDATGYEFQFNLDEDTNIVYFGGYIYGVNSPHMAYEKALYNEVMIN
jgi:hypothetical protein